MNKAPLILIKGTKENPAYYLYFLYSKEVFKGLILLNQPFSSFEDKLLIILEKNKYGKKEDLVLVDNFNKLSNQDKAAVYASLDTLFKDKRIDEIYVKSILGISQTKSTSISGTTFIEF